MKRTIISTAAAIALVAASVTAVLADPPVPAKGHGQAVSEVAKAYDALSEQSHGQIVSAIAKGHGALVSAAAKAHGQEQAAAGKAKGEEAAASGAANGAEASEPGRLKAEAGAGNANGAADDTGDEGE